MVTAVDCTIARVEKSDDKEFLVQYLATDKYFEKVSEALAGGTRQRISRSNLANFSVPIPPIPNEQYQIGRTLTQCDLFISQARCRIRKLEQFRQAMLEKLFPREGETEPELRFRGFSGPWQKKFVRDITKATYGGGTPSTSRSEFWTGDIPWIQSSDISENDIWHVFPKKCISQQALTLTAAQKIPANSIALVTRVGVGKLAFMPFPYTTSQDFLSLSNLVTDGYFTTCALQKKMAEDMTIVQGTSIKGVTKDEILTKVIAVPTNISEQKKIGDFFHQLDSYISLQKEKLDKLHRLKAALLDKLFV